MQLEDIGRRERRQAPESPGQMDASMWIVSLLIARMGLASRVLR